jgi:hypothetical protein
MRNCWIERWRNKVGPIQKHLEFFDDQWKAQFSCKTSFVFTYYNDVSVSFSLDGLETIDFDSANTSTIIAKTFAGVDIKFKLDKARITILHKEDCRSWQLKSLKWMSLGTQTIYYPNPKTYCYLALQFEEYDKIRGELRNFTKEF